MTELIRDLLSMFIGGEDEENRLPTTAITIPAKVVEEDDEVDEYYEAEYNEEGDDFLVQEAVDDEEEEDTLSFVLDTLTSDIAPQYKEDRKTLKYVYTLFSREIPAINPDACQYLSASFDIREAKHGVFPRLVLSEMHPICSAKPITNAPDTFLVNKRLDYIYGRVIETALLGGSARQEAMRVFHKRSRALEVCHVNHLDEERGCPLDWIVYTKMNSAFYQFCSNHLVKHNPYINYQINAVDAIKYERLSFYLVLFLCGEFMDGKECNEFTSVTLESSRTTSPNIQHLEYGEINQWLKVPLWFLDLWLVSQTSVI